MVRISAWQGVGEFRYPVAKKEQLPIAGDMRLHSEKRQENL
jgi:hypothetical protein